jgi:hypothetical protein
MARSFAQIHKAEPNPITTPGIYEYGAPGQRRARTYSQVIGEATRGIEAGAVLPPGKQGPNGPPTTQRQVPDWRGHYLGKMFATPVGKVEAPGTLYVHRPLTNAADLHLWAKGAGIPNLVPPEEMHVTQVYSRQPVSGLNVMGNSVTVDGGARSLAPLGDKGAVVLHFASDELAARHQEAMAAGASHDWPKYLTHVTLSYDAGGIDLGAIAPPSFPLVFGPEIHAPINEDWAEEKGLRKVIKAEAFNEELGLVFGWAIVCKEDGAAYYDLNIDWEGEFAGQRVPEHITEPCMLKGAFDFAMTPDRPGNEMHAGPETGSFAFLWPLTGEIAKAMGITCKRTGLMVAYKPEPAVLAKFKSGEYTGFSIEGFRGHSEEHD